MTKSFHFKVPTILWFLILLVALLTGACGASTIDVPTSVAPTSAVLPDAPIPSIETQILLPATITPSTQPSSSPVPSATLALVPPTATATAGAHPNPDQITGDPPEALGDPDWIDTFDTSANWTLYNNDCFRSKIENGKMVMTGLTQNICWLVTLPNIQNYYLEVTMDTSACPTGGEFGLYFRGPETTSGYSYTLSCTLNYLLVARNGQSGTKTTLLDTPLDPELAWPTWENRLGVLAFENRYRLFVNGVFLNEVTDDQFVEAGLIGLVVRGGAMYEEQTVTFDNLAYWEFPATAVGTPYP